MPRPGGAELTSLTAQTLGTAAGATSGRALDAGEGQPLDRTRVVPHADAACRPQAQPLLAEGASSSRGVDVAGTAACTHATVAAGRPAVRPQICGSLSRNGMRRGRLRPPPTDQGAPCHPPNAGCSPAWTPWSRSSPTATGSPCSPTAGWPPPRPASPPVPPVLSHDPDPHDPDPHDPDPHGANRP